MVAIVQLALAKHAGSTEGVITDWYHDDLSPKVRAEFQRVIKDLRILPAARWDRPDYGRLDEGIGEIRFKGDHIEWRPLGFFAPRAIAEQIIRNLGFESETEAFIIVIGASKKQGSRRGRDHANWTPRNAEDSAVRIRNEIINGGGGAAFHVLEF